MQSFRLDGQYLFLTYPRCVLARDQALDLITTKLGNCTITHHAVAREEHEDGHPHLHMLLILATRKSFRRADFADIAGYHGNYQTAKNKKKVWEYVTKADTDILTNMSDDFFASKTTTRDEIGKMILAGEKPEELVEKYPRLIFGFKRLQEDIKALGDAKLSYAELPTWLPNPWGKLLRAEFGQKKRHLWIWSEGPNKGKTTWAKELEAKYGAYIKSADFTYWNVTGRETLIILDDYNAAGLRYNALNQLCDGSYEARVFLGGVRKLRPTLVIVLANLGIRDIYPNMFNLLYARFIEIKL